LRDRVHAVAVDHRWSPEADLGVIEIDLGSESTSRCGDFGDRDQVAHLDDFPSRQEQDRSLLPTHLSEPEFASSHS